MSTLHLTGEEHDALDRLLEAFLATEEGWEILPHLRTIHAKMRADQGTPTPRTTDS
jgi:hypothetical protein